MYPGLRDFLSKDADAMIAMDEKMRRKNQVGVRKQGDIDDDALFAVSELLDQEGEYLQAHWIYT